MQLRRSACSLPPTVATPSPSPAPSTPSFSPRRTSHLIHLLLSLSSTSFVLLLLHYLLSPSHLVLFLLRGALQLQIANPRRSHPTRSLRFFTIVWAAVTGAALAVHALGGSRGTKGAKGWMQGGLILDFVGQSVTPSTFHLLTLDVLLAFLQLTTLIVAFGATVPSDLDASAATAGGGGEAARDYGGLLGERGTFVDDEEEGREEDGEGEERRAGGRRKNGHSALEDEEDEDDAEEDDLPSTHYGPSSSTSYAPLPSSLSSRHPPRQAYTRLAPVADIRLGVVLREVGRSAAASKRAGEERRLEDAEEGRGGEGG
ncbi:hypothetical protein JCM8097_007139 [Rhodosporidiobolus ruineniae]